MSSVSIRLEGDTEKLLAKLKSLSQTDRAGTMNAIAEGLRTSTVDRFDKQQAPDGTRWRPSIRARADGGKTLIRSSALRNSIHAASDGSGAAVGTNLIYAATHQFGDERTIKAKNGKYLRFKVGGRWVSKESVRIRIPARPFLGISEEDERDIREMLEGMFED